MKPTLKTAIIILAICAIAGPSMAGALGGGDRPAKQRTTTSPAPPIPGIPDASQQYRNELARVTELLAKNPNAFGGFNTTNTLDEIRAEVDRNIRTRHAREIANAATPAERARLAAKHEKFWAGLNERRELRTKFTDEQNIVHSLMMILTTKAKLK